MTTSTLWTPEELAAWSPPEKLIVSEWADRHRVLDALTSSEPGRYSSKRTPYACEWQDNASNSRVRQTTIVAGTQVGKTETLNNVIGFAIAQDPGPAMLVVPRDKDVLTAVQRRVLPMLRASPALRDQLTTAPRDLKNHELAFRRSVLYLRSSQSPADLASVPVRYLLADEVDKFPRWSGREAAPLDLARERTRTFWNASVYVTSTPTTRSGIVWREFLEGDRRRYWVPCPSCERRQVLEWGQIKFAAADARELRRTREAVYACRHCGVSIPDGEKRRMLAAGVWVPEQSTFEEWVERGARERDRCDHRSYHLWAGYSPWLKWWEIAAKFLESRGDPEREQNWVNSWLAEVWEEQLTTPEASNVDLAIVRGARIGEVPEGVLVATGGADVQKDRIVYVVRGWGYDEESWLLAAGEVSTFDELENVFCSRPWVNGGTIGVRCAMVDSRYRRDEMLDMARRRPSIRLAAGVDRQGPLDLSTTKLERHPKTGQPLPTSLLIWTVRVARFKDYLAARQANPSTWHLPEDLPPGYREQVVSEHKVRVRTGQNELERWILKPGSRQNHFWDAEVYACAAAKLIRIEMLKRPDSPPKTPPTPRPPQRPAAKRRPGSGGGYFRGIGQ